MAQEEMSVSTAMGLYCDMFPPNSEIQEWCIPFERDAKTMFNRFLNQELDGERPNVRVQVYCLCLQVGYFFSVQAHEEFCLSDRDDDGKVGYVMDLNDEERAQADTTMRRKAKALLQYVGGCVDSVRNFQQWILSATNVDDGDIMIMIQQMYFADIESFHDIAVDLTVRDIGTLDFLCSIRNKYMSWVENSASPGNRN